MFMSVCVEINEVLRAGSLAHSAATQIAVIDTHKSPFTNTTHRYDDVLRGSDTQNAGGLLGMRDGSSQQPSNCALLSGERCWVV